MVVGVFIPGIAVVAVGGAIVPVGRITVGIEVMGLTPVMLGITGTGLVAVAVVPDVPTGLIVVPIGRITWVTGIVPTGRMTVGDVPTAFTVPGIVAVPAVGLVMPGIVAVITGRTPVVVVTGLVTEVMAPDVGRVIVVSPGTVVVMAPMGLLNVPFGRRTTMVAPRAPPTLEATGRTPTVLPAMLKLDGMTDLVGTVPTGLIGPVEAASVDIATGRDITGDLADKPGATDTLAEAVPFNAPFAPPVNPTSTLCCPALSSVISVNTTERVCFGSTVPSDFVCICFPSMLSATPTPAMLAEYGFITENVSEEAWPAIGTAPFRANTMSVTWGRPTGIFESTWVDFASMPPGPVLPAPEPPTTLIPPSVVLPEPDLPSDPLDALEPLDAVEPLAGSLPEAVPVEDVPEVVPVEDVPEDAVAVEPVSVAVDVVPEPVVSVPLVPPASATVTFTDF
jgi:hypothetical protein